MSFGLSHDCSVCECACECVCMFRSVENALMCGKGVAYGDTPSLEIEQSACWESLGCCVASLPPGHMQAPSGVELLGFGRLEPLIMSCSSSDLRDGFHASLHSMPCLHENWFWFPPTIMGQRNSCFYDLLQRRSRKLRGQRYLGAEAALEDL